MSSEAAPETFEQYIRRLQALYPAHAMAIRDHGVRMFADSYRPSDVEAIASLLRWARKFETAAAAPAPSVRRVVVELPPGWQAPAVEEPDPEQEDAARQKVGMAPKAKPARAFYTKAEKAWLAEMRQQEGADLTSQKLIEPLVTLLPPLHFTAYVYLRALACNSDHPGIAVISHERLGQKIHVKERAAKKVTAALRADGLVERRRKGSKLYRMANAYRLVPLTPDVLAKVKVRRERGTQVPVVEGTPEPSIATP